MCLSSTNVTSDLAKGRVLPYTLAALQGRLTLCQAHPCLTAVLALRLSHATAVLAPHTAFDSIACSLLPWMLPQPSLSISTMPGSSTIFGLIPCSNSRYLHPEKPRTVTFDCEIVMGVNNGGNVHTVTALLVHFTLLCGPTLTDGTLCLVFGKCIRIGPMLGYWM